MKYLRKPVGPIQRIEDRFFPSLNTQRPEVSGTAFRGSI